MENAIYYFDTAGFMEPWNKHYPFEIFPSFWKKIDDMIDEGTIISVRAVYDELSRYDDELLAWAKQRREIFLEPTEDIQNVVRQVLCTAPKLYEAKTDRSGADPFVVALAKLKNATLVSDEKRVARRKDITIHQACDLLEVPSMRVLEFIREQGWTF